jgi:hypothetical protein
MRARTIARVFPRRTKATPDDALAFINPAPLAPPKADEIHISVAFTWDLPQANYLYSVWRDMGLRVKIGGPAFDDPGAIFTPGLYLRRGYVMTSRGCPGRCQFCFVPKREGGIRELPIEEGWNVLDSNLLACSYRHVCAVIEMLKRRKERPQFTGGIEAARLEAWSAEAIRSVMPAQVFLAYDTPGDWHPLVRAAQLLWKAGFTPAAHRIRAYVLIGEQGDTFEAAESRLRAVQKLGIVPMAMLWRGPDGKVNPRWRQFQRPWARPAMLAGRVEAA